MTGRGSATVVADEGQVDELVDPVAANEAALRALWVRFKSTADASTREAENEQTVLTDPEEAAHR